MKRVFKKKIRLLKKKHLIQPRPRLCVFRSLNHIYAQVVDDGKGQTVVSASSKDADIKTDGQGKAKVAGMVGELVGKRAVEKGQGAGHPYRCSHAHQLHQHERPVRHADS